MPRAIAAALAVLTASVGLAQAQWVDPLPARAGRLIVKYRPTVSQCVHCLLARHAPFSALTGTDSLDHLHARVGARSAQALFSGDHGGERSQKYHDDREAIRARHARRASRAPRSAREPDLSNVFVLEIDPGVDPTAAAGAFARDPDVEYAEPDMAVQVGLTPSDPFFGTSGSFGQSFPDLWGLHVTGAEHAWNVANGSGVVVAVVDTGIKEKHVDLKANVWTNAGEIPRNRIDDDGNGFVDDVLGWDFIKNKNKVTDRHGHGTHVAGTIAAAGDNAIGVVGMAWGARIMTVRGLDERGRGFTSNLVKAIRYAIDNGADVVNNSWGGGGRSQIVDDVVAEATSQGVVVVFAAGNESSGVSTGAAPGAIAVAATQHDDTRATFSNYGQYVSVAAPGVQVLSTRGASRVGGTKVGGKYQLLSGTSMAAPHVAGLIAVLLSAQPGLGIDDVRWRLELNADQPGWPGYEGRRFNPFFGYGRINAARVFDPPPVTTRITTTGATFHALAGTSRPNALSTRFGFTTHDPVAWTLSGPGWLVPETPTGTGDATVASTLDATTVGIGSHAGTLDLTAPAAVDGGGSLGVAVHVHADRRAGEPFVLAEARSILAPPAVAGDGQGTFFAWIAWPASGSPDLMGAYIGSEGAITGPFVIDPGWCEPDRCQVKNGFEVAATFDGSAFLVAWNEEEREYPYSGNRRRHDRVKAVRVSAAGAVLAPPVTLAENVETANNDNSYDQYFYGVDAASDGNGSVVLWGQIDWSESYARAFRFWTRRVDLAGAAPAAKQVIYPTSDTVDPQSIDPKIACLPDGGPCLVAWHEADGEYGVDHYIDKIVGKRFVGDVAIDPAPRRIVRDGEALAALTTGPGQFLVSTYRFGSCSSGNCYDVAAARMAADGTALDPDGVVVNEGGAGALPAGSFAGVADAAFDGTNYWITWSELADASSSPVTCHPFAARIGTSGGVLDAEPSGLLMTAVPPVCGYAPSTIAIAGDRSLTSWIDLPSRVIVQPGTLP